MTKIRILFMVVVLLVCVGSFFLLYNFQAPFAPGIGEISEFKITKISGPGAVYMDKKPIKEKDFSQAEPVDIKTMSHAHEMYLETDPQTAFEFYCLGTVFTVLPDSYLYFQPSTREFRFYNGMFFWHKEIKQKSIEISIAAGEQTGAGSPQKRLTLSDAGKLRIAEDSIEIWNHAGSLKFTYEGESHGLIANQVLRLSLKGRPKLETFDLLPAPEFISPEHKVISVNRPADSLVNFSWKAVRGAKEYRLRLYSSPLQENLLEEWTLAATSKAVNLQKHNEFKEFYWQVSPYDSGADREGVPAKIGYVKLAGVFLGETGELLPPKLVITALTVSGNMVLIKGEADVNGKLFINEKPVSINMDGTFIDTINFDSMGIKTIQFRLVGPTEIETNITRQVTIFDE